ncbi:toprim domain-containing protein [Candidatus Bathyarchaeota archaeon]|nr:toprim domain-containing protein [Candidatus Bathyarchaeota archaeon]
MARLKEKEERLCLLFSALAEESAKGTPIIVEGKRDADALRALNIKGPIISAKTGGRSLLSLVSEIEQLQTSEVILLLDFDRRGKEFTRRLKQHLEASKTTVSLAFWLGLFKLVGKETKNVENLAKYMETLKSKICNS